MLISTNREKVLSRRLTFNQFWPITIFTLRIWAWKMEKTMASLRRSFPFSLARPNSPLPLLTPATQASYRKVFLSFVNELQQNSDAFSKEEYILISMEFLSLSRRRSSWQNVLVQARSKEKRLYTQARLFHPFPLFYPAWIPLSAQYIVTIMSWECYDTLTLVFIILKKEYLTLLLIFSCFDTT